MLRAARRRAARGGSWLAASSCLLAICAATAATAATPQAHAGAAPLAVSLEVSARSHAGVNRLTVLVRSAAGATCSLSVTAEHLVKSFPGRQLSSSGSVAWRWEPPAPASQTPWAFYATCTSGSISAWRRVRVEMGFPTLAGALDLASPLGGRSCDAQGLCFAEDPFPVGQCTWYAEGRRPDLRGVVRGNAGGWLAAAKGRVPEGATPVVGALAVWLPGVGPAGSLGHVGYVSAVARGRILLDDSNWRPTPTSSGLEVHEHWERAGSPTGYIYGGPAGAGPS